MPWGVDRIDADKVWATNTGSGIKVAVLDTGIDIDHSDLKTNVRGGINTVGSEPSENYDDTHGHGTIIAGIVAAIDNTEGVIGVGPGISPYAVRFRKDLPILPDPNGALYDLYQGIEWCIQNGMQVINMSFTVWTVKYVKKQPQPDKPLHDPVFYSLIQQAYNAGIVLVGAIGNDSVRVKVYDAATYIPGDMSYRFPASYKPEVIGVSAIDNTNGFASFSNYGPAVDLAAPGVSVETTTIGGYGSGSGTSAACPHVVGVAALVLKQFGPQSPDWVKTRLKDTAEWLAKLTAEQQGSGLVDAEKAVFGASAAPRRHTVSSTGKLPVTWGELKGK